MTATRIPEVTVELGERSYPVRLAAGGLTNFGKVVARQSGASRAIVLTVPEELEDWGAQKAINRYKISEQQWRDNGAEIIRFSAADQKRYMDAIRKVGVDHLSNHKNAEVRETYARFKKAVAATR